MYEATIAPVGRDMVLSLFGPRDQHLRAIREALGVAVAHRDGEIRISGEEGSVARATQVLEQLKHQLERAGSLEPYDVTRTLDIAMGRLDDGQKSAIDIAHLSKKIVPRTNGQIRYVDTIRANDLTFGIGPAGSGKTYLAVALAVEALKQRKIRKIVLCRPAVEAGESLGYLPGDLQAKINPYLRPLLDALHEMIDHEQIKRFMEQDVIEVIPLAYMRGRTLNEAFIILDEAQNCTPAQMKMFLTRMGNLSKIVVSGDITQIDLPRNVQCGLVDALSRLQGITGIGTVELTKSDIVRHRLVAEIVRAYDETESDEYGGRSR